MIQTVSTLPGTAVRCTPEVLDRLGAIAVPFVRRVTAAKVAEAARAQGITLVDAAFFARASSY
ncbi:MAG: hypothetical protein A2X52_09085 [Candidatus Rokubacteria bacterium GWC2_70_16]|nr:MAG: hypothetical protein A2X52_09085 [Candidatus Rokubacteria bacterium GWC2_70_16]